MSYINENWDDCGMIYSIKMIRKPEIKHTMDGKIDD